MIVELKRSLNTIDDILDLLEKDAFTDKLTRKIARLLLKEWDGVKSDTIKAVIDSMKGSSDLQALARAKELLKQYAGVYGEKAAEHIVKPLYEIVSGVFSADVTFGYSDSAAKAMTDVVKHSFANKPADFVDGFLKLIDESATSGQIVEHLRDCLEIPKLYKNGDFYYYQLSQHIGSTASAVHATEKADVNGAKYLVVSAVMDERTSEICAQLNGTKITITDAKNHCTKLFSTDPKDLNDAMPWPSVNNGIVTGLDKHCLPPYHFGCRTIVVQE